MQEKQSHGSEMRRLYSGSKKPPCKDCPDRHVACHSTCEKFKAWEEIHRAQKEKELLSKKKRWVETARKIKGIKPKER